MVHRNSSLSGPISLASRGKVSKGSSPVLNVVVCHLQQCSAAVCFQPKLKQEANSPSKSGVLSTVHSHVVVWLHFGVKTWHHQCLMAQLFLELCRSHRLICAHVMSPKNKPKKKNTICQNPTEIVGKLST